MGKTHKDTIKKNMAHVYTAPIVTKEGRNAAKKHAIEMGLSEMEHGEIMTTLRNEHFGKKK